MDSLYTKLESADVLILAAPVYTPLPGDLRNILDQLG
jgi:multimeric flavodoxin WrbA